MTLRYERPEFNSIGLKQLYQEQNSCDVQTAVCDTEPLKVQFGGDCRLELSAWTECHNVADVSLDCMV